MRNIIDITDLSLEEIDQLIEDAINMRAHPENYSELMKGKNLATLFYEPSTRTRLSFTSAMYALGGNVLGFSEPSSSSVSKGENVTDTSIIVSGYSDIIVMRHPLEGAPFAASLRSAVPVINAGDGGHFHPTQTLTDLTTIKCETGRLTNLKIGICGDLKYGRTVHSLIAAMSRYEGNEFILISPDELKTPKYTIEDYLDKTGCIYSETSDLLKALPEIDVLYMTRIQQERFDNMNDYERLKDVYILTPEKLKYAKKDMIVMHPLPRVNEIYIEVDTDPRAKYFEQALYGKFIRMALIKFLIEKKNENEDRNFKIDDSFTCKNPKCITASQSTLPHLVKKDDKSGALLCAYCN